MYLADLTRPEVERLLSELGEPKYRAKQVWEWLNRGARVEEMTNLSAAMREKLAALPYGGVVIGRTFLSASDGTVKSLFRL